MHPAPSSISPEHDTASTPLVVDLLLAQDSLARYARNCDASFGGHVKCTIAPIIMPVPLGHNDSTIEGHRRPGLASMTCAKLVHVAWLR
jgi:hypothetical protein